MNDCRTHWSPPAGSNPSTSASSTWQQKFVRFVLCAPVSGLSAQYRRPAWNWTG
jgi:hypothetical protein